jgi:hypothetical protein
MAIKGEMIDVTKLQDYELKNGWEILFLEKDSGSSVVHPVCVLFKDSAGTICFNRYTDEGFSSSDKNPSEFDLVLKNRAEEQPQETKKRKVVQISTCLCMMSECHDVIFVHALCDDGTLFERVNGQDWEKLTEIPQD